MSGSASTARSKVGGELSVLDLPVLGTMLRLWSKPASPGAVSQREPSVLGAAALCRLLPAALCSAMTGMVRSASALGGGLGSYLMTLPSRRKSLIL